MPRLLRGLTLSLCLLLISAALPAWAQVVENGVNSQQPQPEPAHRPNVIQHTVGTLPWQAVNSSTDGCSPAGAHLTYFGGPVISNAHIVEVLYGSGSYLPKVSSTTPPSIASFFGDILGANSGYIDLLTQYNTPASGGTGQTIGNGTFDGLFQIVPSAANDGSTIDDTQVQAELLAQISGGHLPAPFLDAAGNVNTIYFIYFPPGKTITLNGQSSCSSFCAYHGATSNTLNSKHLLYGVLPDFQSGGCSSSCGGSSTFGNYTTATSHELTEAITDADAEIATTFAPPLAWYDKTNGEIGDICNQQQGSYTANGTTYTIQYEFSNAANNCVLPAASTPDFIISIQPCQNILFVNVGTSANFTVTVNAASGFAGTVNLSVSGQLNHVTTSLNPASVSGSGASTLTVNVGPMAKKGIPEVLTITGTSGSLSHSTSVTLFFN